MAKRLSKTLKKEFFSLPNILTYIRVACIPFIVFFLLMGGNEMLGPETRQWMTGSAFLFFTLAALTDYLDGWLARRYNCTTLVGKFVDPIADKLIVLATLVALVELHRIDSWIVVLILLREISISGLRTLALAEGLTINVIKAGKLKTAFQLAGIQALILHAPFDFWILPAPADLDIVGSSLILISLFFSFVSAASYFNGFVTAIKAKYEEMERNEKP